MIGLFAILGWLAMGLWLSIAIKDPDPFNCMMVCWMFGSALSMTLRDSG